MSRFLIGSAPLAGHVHPLLSIAEKLIAHGHDVCWYTGSRFQSQIEALGATFCPMRDEDDYDKMTNPPPTANREKTGFVDFKFNVNQVFGLSAFKQLKQLKTLLAEYNPNIIVCDTGFWGSVILMETEKHIPWAVVNITSLTVYSRDTAPFGTVILPNSSPLGRVRNRLLRFVLTHILLRDITSFQNELRSGIGLPPVKIGLHFNNVVSPYLHIQLGIPGFEYPRSDLPPQVHFVGPCLPGPPAAFVQPPWWGAISQKDLPVVLVTQGTLANGTLDDLIMPAIRALAGKEVFVIATTGNLTAEQAGIKDLPANARIEPFIPYHHLMPHVAVMITNGGYGSIQIALAHGVPMIAAGATEEKPENCNRIAWSGAGINLKTKTPTAEQIQGAVQTVLGDAKYKRNALRLGKEIGQHDAPAEAVKLLEQLAATKQPVIR